METNTTLYRFSVLSTELAQVVLWFKKVRKVDQVVRKVKRVSKVLRDRRERKVSRV